MVNTIIRLRRDNQYNYEKIKDRFIPANGEICLVDTAKDGLRAVCGDGKTPFGKLQYLNDIIIQGYYYNSNFYADSNHTEAINASSIRIYIDKYTNSLYYYDGISYIKLSGATGSIPTASAEAPGIMKLYNTIGNNTDGTMSQKAITDELDDKVEIQLNKDEELLIFTY